MVDEVKEAGMLCNDCDVELTDDVIVFAKLLFREVAMVVLVFLPMGDVGGDVRLVSDKTESIVRVSEADAGVEMMEGAGDVDIDGEEKAEEARTGEDGDEAVSLTRCLWLKGIPKAEATGAKIPAATVIAGFLVCFSFLFSLLSL